MLKGEIWQEGELEGSPLLPQLIFTPDHSIFAEKFPRDFKRVSPFLGLRKLSES